MREFNFRLTETFQNGLRPNTRIDRNTTFLTEAFNVQFSEYGMESFLDITDPFNGNETVSFPYPQLFIGESQTLLVGDSIKTVDTSVSPWTTSTQTTYDGRDPSSQKGISGDGIWHFADMKDFWYLFNGTSVVFKTNHGALNFEENKILVLDDISINTGLYHRGRILIGGFDPNDFWNDNWQNLFEAWKDSVGERIPFAFDDIGSNYVMWSSIGGGDFPLWLFYPEIAVEGFMADFDDSYDYNIENSFLLEAMQKGEFGFMPMPWQGTIQKMIPLGKNVIVYGDEGVAALTPTPPTTPVGAPTFGLQNIENVGAVSRGAAFGGEKTAHMFVDQGGYLWTINGELQAQRLGYNEFFFSMLSNDIVISHNQHRDDFFISDGNDTFVFDNGLSEVKQHPTSVQFFQGGLVGLFEEDSDDEMRVVTTTFDLGIRGSKVITAVLLGMDRTTDDNTVQVSVDYRTKNSSSFVRSPFFPINHDGYSEIRVQGIEFRLVIKASDFENLNIDYAEVRYQSEDKRYIRGTSASETPS